MLMFDKQTNRHRGKQSCFSARDKIENRLEALPIKKPISQNDVSQPLIGGIQLNTITTVGRIEMRNLNDKCLPSMSIVM